MVDIPNRHRRDRVTTCRGLVAPPHPIPSHHAVGCDAAAEGLCGWGFEGLRFTISNMNVFLTLQVIRKFIVYIFFLSVWNPKLSLKNLFSFFFMFCGESLMSESSRAQVTAMYIGDYFSMMYICLLEIWEYQTSNGFKWCVHLLLGLKDEIRQYHEIMKALMSMLIRSKMKRNHKL